MLDFQVEHGAFDKIIVESSPFLRTLQTATKAARRLTLSDEIKRTFDGKIVVNYKYSEVLTDQLFKEDPLRELLYNRNDISSKYLDNISLVKSEP